MNGWQVITARVVTGHGVASGRKLRHHVEIPREQMGVEPSAQPIVPDCNA